MLKILTGVVGILVIIFVIYLITDAKERAVVTINDAKLRVKVADTPWERQQGLSGVDLKDLNADGMLFVFPDSEVRNFWMKNMEFALDVIWIKEGKIVSIDHDVQPPEDGGEPERISSNPVAVDMVLEVPAGVVENYGLKPGHSLRIELP